MGKMRDAGILLVGVAALIFVLVESYVSISYLNFEIQQWSFVP
jgi:hypothetical protein